MRPLLDESTRPRCTDALTGGCAKFWSAAKGTFPGNAGEPPLSKRPCARTPSRRGSGVPGWAATHYGVAKLRHRPGDYL